MCSRPLSIINPLAADDYDPQTHQMSSKFEQKVHNSSVKTTAGFHPIKDFFLLNKSKHKYIKHKITPNAFSENRLSYYEQRALERNEDDFFLEGTKHAFSPSRYSISQHYMTGNEFIPKGSMFLAHKKQDVLKPVIEIDNTDNVGLDFNISLSEYLII